MFNALFDFCTALVSEQPRAIVTGAVGLAVGASVVAFPAVNAFRARRRDAARFRKTIDGLTAKLDEQADVKADLAEKQTQLLQQLDESTQRLNESESATERALNEVDLLNNQIQAVVDCDGKVWEAPVPDDIPAFVPRQHRRAKILSVVNLKGGVGKTTLSANLGATLASMKGDVLVVDLDYQHSLSDLCFREQQRTDLKRSGRLIDNIFQLGGALPRFFEQCIQRIGNTQLHCVACDELLADEETRTMARWLVGKSDDDARYLLRALLHHKSLSERFDWIILDCPPRLTTATINALAASDYVLIPVILDDPSTNAVPRMVKWLYRLKHEARVCPDVSLMGIVANLTQQAPALTSAENENWLKLQGYKIKWNDPIHYFKRFIPRKTVFAQAAAKNQFAALQNEVKPIFLDLATEVGKRVPV